MSSLLPPGIPALTADQIRPELVAYLHGEETAYSRDTIAYYLDRDPELKADHQSLIQLASMLKHTPAVDPSRQFRRRVVKALPRLRAEGYLSPRMEQLIDRARWNLEDRWRFVLEYARYSLKTRPVPFLVATLGSAALLLLLVNLPALVMMPDEQRPAFIPGLASNTDFGKPGNADLPSDINNASNSDGSALANSAAVVDREGPPDINPDIQPGNGPDRDESVDGAPPRPGVREPWELQPDHVPPEYLRDPLVLQPTQPQVLDWFAARVDQTVKAARPAREQAMIDAALDWLCANQQASGAWAAETRSAPELRPLHGGTAPPDRTFPSREVPGPGGELRVEVLDSTTIELTGLSLLALLADGVGSYSRTPPSPRNRKEREAWREVELPRFERRKHAVQNGIAFLIAQQNTDTGQFGGEREADSVMAHAIATLALVEDFAVSGNYLARRNIALAVQYLHLAQNGDGFWGYQPDDDLSELTPTFWAVSALRAAAYTGAATIGMDDSIFDNTRRLLNKLRMPADTDLNAESVVSFGDVLGRYAPQTLINSFRPTSVGIALTRMLDVRDKPMTLAERDRVVNVMTGAVRLLTSAADDHDYKPTWNYIDYYYWYYGSLAMANVAPVLDANDSRVVAWRSALVDLLAAKQYAAPTGDPANDTPEQAAKRAEALAAAGAWPAAGGDWRRGRVLSTALGALALLNTNRYSWVIDN